MQGSVAAVGDAAAALVRAVRGAVLTPGQTRYDDACALHNGAVRHRPAAIVQPASVSDIQATLALALDHDLRVSVRGAGHGLDGAAMAGDIVIDMRPMRGVTVDPRARTTTVRGGATWADLDEATGAHALVVPGSRVGTVGVAGATIAGGDGWLTPRYGTTRSNLLAADVVTVDGVATVDSLDGRSTVVTSMVFALHPQPAEVVAGCLLYRLADGADVASAIDALVARDQPEFAPLLRWQTAPPAAYVPGDLVGRPVIAVYPVWLGAADTAADFLAPLGQAARPLADATRVTSYAELQRQLDAASRWGRRRDERTLTTAPNVTNLVGQLDAACADRPGSSGFVELVPASTGTTVRAEAQWIEPADDEREQTWLDAFMHSTESTTT